MTRRFPICKSCKYLRESLQCKENYYCHKLAEGPHFSEIAVNYGTPPECFILFAVPDKCIKPDKHYRYAKIKEKLDCI